MTESILRIAYFAIGIYTFSSSLLTSTILSRADTLSAVEKLSLGSIWVSFVSFVLIVTWASKAATAKPGHKLSESFLRVSFLTMGLFFGTCAVASTMALTASNSALQDWFCVGGLWFAFVSFCGIIVLPGRVGSKAGAAVAEPSTNAHSA
ncbi:hypothetical protein QO021_29035 (plasmid) [Pseudomonas amygdali pv. lachrymans]|uniref:hypothetical protein n=1 Tax=Pseudomonas amygdali TaxID=47877 RepID=UPI0006B9D97D|nr:hypothetical protein [Pseudomonas amygdali]KPC02224.1 putative transmembrane protein [Pseudomonas amygdali pv. lachrymans]RMM39165.1 hypothetical protein ALQ79_200449 [Pseudomonas amygdali pv. lachrymans]WIO61605.1 hypothetical protein QO021_29035 [Pseudomonas amygdali pv. lachrymans]